MSFSIIYELMIVISYRLNQLQQMYALKQNKTKSNKNKQTHTSHTQLKVIMHEYTFTQSNKYYPQNNM